MKSSKTFLQTYPTLHVQLTTLPDPINNISMILLLVGILLFQLTSRPCSNQLKAGPNQPLTHSTYEYIPWEPLDGSCTATIYTS